MFNKEVIEEITLLHPDKEDYIVITPSPDVKIDDIIKTHDMVKSFFPNNLVLTIPPDTYIAAYDINDFAEYICDLLDTYMGRPQYIELLKSELNKLCGEDSK